MQETNRILRQFVTRSGMPLKKLAEALEMPSTQIMAWVCGEESLMSHQKIELLAKYLGISTTDIVQGTFSSTLVRQRIYAGPLVLPEKYGLNAHSNTRTSAHIIDFLRLYIGQRKTDRLLTEMGVHPLIFDGLDNKININFLCDLLRLLQNSEDLSLSIAKLAKLSPIFLRETEFIKNFKGCDSYEELYSIIMNNIDKFDKNFEYKVSISETGLSFQAFPSEFLTKLMSEGNGQYINFKDLFLYRKHLLGSYPMMINMEPLEVIAKKAIYKGNHFDEYEISFPKNTRKSTLTLIPMLQDASFWEPESPA